MKYETVTALMSEAAYVAIDTGAVTMIKRYL
jgi:hypothetical protein